LAARGKLVVLLNATVAVVVLLAAGVVRSLPDPVRLLVSVALALCGATCALIHLLWFRRLWGSFSGYILTGWGVTALGVSV